MWWCAAPRLGNLEECILGCRLMALGPKLREGKPGARRWRMTVRTRYCVRARQNGLHNVCEQLEIFLCFRPADDFFSVNTTFTERTVEARLYSSKSLLHNTQLRSFRPSEMARCKEADIKSINTRTTYSVVVGHREGHLKF